MKSNVIKISWKEKRKYRKFEKYCEEISELDDDDFAVCVALLGFKRVLDVVEKWADNYRQKPKEE